MKNRKTMFLLLGISLILYSAIVWIVPWQKNFLMILSYIFTVIAFAAQGVLWKYAWQNSDNAMSKFYGIPVIRIGVIYLIIQTIISVLVMLGSERIPTWIPTLVYIVLLGAFLIGTILSVKIKDQIDTLEVAQKKETHVIKKLRVEADYLSNTYRENEKLQTIKDDLKYSDPVSSDALREEEKELALLMEQMGQALKENEMGKFTQVADEFIVKLKKRNKLCKIYK